MADQWISTSTPAAVSVRRRVGRRHAAVAQCLVDVIQTYSGTKVYIEQTISGLSHVVNNEVEHASHGPCFRSKGITKYMPPFSPRSLPAQASLLQPAPALVTWSREPRRSSLTDIHTSTLSTLYLGDHRAPWIPCKEDHQHPHERRRLHAPSVTHGQQSTVNSTPRTSHFSHLRALIFNVTSTLAQVWRAAHISLHPIFMRS